MMQILLRFPVAIALASSILAPGFARAELDCVVKTREEGFEPSRPGAAELRRVARAVEAIVQRNSVFMTGNEPVRVRTTIDYSGWDHLSASVVTTAYNAKAWETRGCAVSRFADRGGSLSEGTIAVYLNDAEAMLGGQIGDAELRMGIAPRRIGDIAGQAVYAVGDRDDNARVAYAAAGVELLVPVTVAELLDKQERELKVRESEARSLDSSTSEISSEAKIQEIYESMRQVDSIEAEKFRSKMLAELPKLRAASAEAGGAVAQQRKAFDAYRASFSPAQLRAPGTLGNELLEGGVVRVDSPAGKRLARIAPDFSTRARSRVVSVVVHVGSQPGTDPEYDWYQASLEAIDFEALAALVGR